MTLLGARDSTITLTATTILSRNSSEIHERRRDGSGFRLIHRFAEPEGASMPIHLDGDTLYWVGDAGMPANGAHIQRLPLAGGQPTQVDTTSDAGAARDPKCEDIIGIDADSLYCSGRSGGIHRISKATGEAVTIGEPSYRGGMRYGAVRGGMVWWLSSGGSVLRLAASAVSGDPIEQVVPSCGHMALSADALFCTHTVIQRYSLEGDLLGAVALPPGLSDKFEATRVVHASSTHLLVLGSVQDPVEARPDAVLLRVSLTAPEATPVGCVRKLGHELFVSQLVADDHQVVWSTYDALLSASY